MKSLHLRSSFMIAVASTLIASMLLGSVLISNVYAKTGDAEQSKYNLDENCLDDHKGKLITLTGSRSVETIDTDLEQETDSKSTTVEDFDAEIDQDAFEDGNISGTLGILNPFVDLEFDPDGNDPLPGNLTDLRLGGTLASQQGDNHFEIGNNFVTRNEDGTVTITPLNDVTDVESESDLDQDQDQRIKDSEKFKKSFPLKERRDFNVCGLPIGNIVDGFQFNEIEGTKKSDILLGTSSADDMSGKGSSDVIQGRDDDDIMHGGAGPDSIQGGFGNDNIHGDDGDDAIFAGPNDDYLNGGDGNDELYSQDGDDTLEGGPGANFFDCGTGFDTVVDFDPSKGDVTNDNCEDVRTVL
jgi:Ca2+-binding RTX toxin-like protein